MEGLAQQMAGQPASTGAQGMPTVEEIIALLMQGVTPEQLLQQGVPEELIVQAIQILQQQMANQEAVQQAPAEQQGLAGEMATGRM